MNLADKKAFSFIEILVVVLISTAVFAGIYSTFLVGNRAWAHYNDSVVVRKEARRGLIGMVNELREAQSVRVIQGPTSTVVQFFTQESGRVTYSWSAVGGDAQQIIRRNRHSNRILANHISLLSVEKIKNGVIIELTASRVTKTGHLMSVTLREKLALRLKTLPKG